jgi:hypothetical protein
MVEEPNPVTEFTVWNGDFDTGNHDGSTVDTDDPNTTNGQEMGTGLPPAILSGTQVNEGAQGIGSPPDNTDEPIWAIGGDIGLELIVPTSPAQTVVADTNPSGNLEWERFVVEDADTASGNEDATTPDMPAGFYSLRVTGLDFTNLTFLYFGRETFSCDPSGLPMSRADFMPLRRSPSSISGRVALDADGDSALTDSDAGFRSLTIKLEGETGQGRPISMEARTNENGAYSFKELEPGTYTISMDSSVYFRRGLNVIGERTHRVRLEFDDVREGVNFMLRDNNVAEEVGTPVEEPDAAESDTRQPVRQPAVERPAMTPGR